MPLYPAFSEKPPISSRTFRVPSAFTLKLPTVPVPESSVYSHLPSMVTAISRFVLPLGKVASTVLAIALNEPSEPIEKPEREPEPAFDV
jgi:hypothetical protein